MSTPLQKYYLDPVTNTFQPLTESQDSSGGGSTQGTTSASGNSLNIASQELLQRVDMCENRLLKIENGYAKLGEDANFLRLTSTEGKMGGFNYDNGRIWNDSIEINSDLQRLVLGTPLSNISLDGSNKIIKSSNYQTGISGFYISPNLVEAENGFFRGTLSGVTFKYDVKSCLGGNTLVTNGDVIAVDMTSSDTSTVTIKASSSFALNEMLTLRAVTANGIQSEDMRITSITNAPTYTVTRDLAGLYGANANPAWSAGTPIIARGFSDGVSTYSGGWLELVGAGTNAPYYSVLKRTGVDYNAYTEALRMGNLNGFLGYSSDEYGIAIGDTTQYFKYDPTNGLRILGNLTVSDTFVAGETLSGGTLPQPVFILPDRTVAETLVIDNSGSGTNYVCDNGPYVSTTTYRAINQSFLATNGYNKVTKVAIVLTRANIDMSAYNVTCDIYAVTGANDTPTGSSLGQASVAAISLSTSAGWITFTFSSPISVQAGTKYCYVVQLSGHGDASHYIVVDGGHAYADGKMNREEDGSGGFSWQNIANDTIFKVYQSYVNIGTVGRVFLSDANDKNRLLFDGFAISSATAGNNVNVQQIGNVGGFTSLSIGSVYYVQDDSTIGTSAGTNSIKVGKAQSITKILVYQLAI